MADPTSDVANLAAQLIRIDTSNAGDGGCRERPAAEYVAERLDDAGIEPTLIESSPGRANVVARVPGTDPDRDAMLVHGHLDVVPAEPADWQVHPFAGDVHDGVLWGRGAVDMKGMDAMMLAVARGWMRDGRRPRRDVVLAFTADEEASAEYGSDWLVRKHADLFEGCTEGISESGAYTFHAGDGVRLYPVAAGERGTAWMRLTAHGRAGHGSKVNTDNAVGALAAALARFDAHEWPVRLTPTVRAALERIGAALGVPVDPDDPGFDADAVLRRLGPARQLVDATLRNSTNPTIMQAGYKLNVIPQTATGFVDGRMLPGTQAEFEATVTELAGPRVDWEYEHSEVPLSADVESPTFAAMADALGAEDTDAHVVPVCMSGGTDAKQFSRLGITGYGFAPLQLPPGFDYGALFHGVDERVPVDALDFGVRVLDRFLTTAG
ncbi:acetylornithine deacetylase/succinyl-diaminopimelate desuccinylase-like protein [Haloactinopolyspora alba]|uniref:Acetylornithine deacetylase/succinyl-diaminopimelate desuccinylase-like protein n=1 Tax=Haloactinopolyspora alba TaxID=648780 RepID=A0A2P8DVD6_9ACTN|nr:M20/M25/M40 family metallo-hydrolase [Haloactinopolyspora alba]PSL01164.1 acetylornithine deacetylase/succinyl-diaminopimelate desuccinylase-like protein [Haloactinopolyspora alba]